MRNLKRALSLTLASVMLLGMMVVGASAKGYSDVTEEENIEAIEVLQAVDVMSGVDEDHFNPDGYVTREQMAVIMSKLLNLNYNYYQGTNPFSDVPAWAAPYVAACAANGITSGIGGGMYGAGQNVNAVQAALMMLKALGYFQYQEDFGDSYILATVKQATEVGLFNGIDSNADSALTRNEVAQMALNALQSDMVSFTGDVGTKIPTANGDVIVGYKAEYTPRTSTLSKYQAIERRSSDVGGTNNLNRGQYYIQLGEELYDGELRLSETIDDYGRPARVWEYNGKSIGTYAKRELMRQSYTVSVKGSDMYNLLGNSVVTDANYTLDVYVDGALYTAPAETTSNRYTRFIKANFTRNNDQTMENTGRGVLTEVYVDIETKEITVAIINTYLAKATSDYSNAREELRVQVYHTGTGVGHTLDVEDFPEIANMKEDDFMLVRWVADNHTNPGSYSDYEVVDILNANIMTDKTVTRYSSGTSQTGSSNDGSRISSLVTDGQTYNANKNLYYKEDTLDRYYYNDNLTGKTYNIYLDQYGNAIGVELYSGADNYVFVTGFDLTGSNTATGNATANAIFLDGTMSNIKVNVNDTNKNIRNYNADPKGDGVGGPDTATYREWTSAVEGTKFGAKLNTWYTYTQNETTGVYTLSPVAQDRQFNTTRGDGSGAGIVEIKSSSLRLSGWNTAQTTPTQVTRSYGDQNSVFITVGTSKDVQIGQGFYVINEVKSVYTGVQNVNIKSDDIYYKTNNGGTPSNTPSENTGDPSVYVLIDSDLYIIGAIVIGKDTGSASNYAYIYENARYEERDPDGTYFWGYNGIVNGERTELKVKSEYTEAVNTIRTVLKTTENATTLSTPYGNDTGYLFRLSFDADGYVVGAEAFETGMIPSGSGTHNDYIFAANTNWNINADDELVRYMKVPVSSNVAGAPANAGEILTIDRAGLTLYNATRNGDAGLAVREDAKITIIQTIRGSRRISEATGLKEAWDYLVDYDESTENTKNYAGTISAVLDGTGRATWVVFDSKGGTNPSQNEETSTGTVSVKQIGRSINIASTSAMDDVQIRAAIRSGLSGVATVEYPNADGEATITFTNGDKGSYAVNVGVVANSAGIAGADKLNEAQKAIGTTSTNGLPIEINGNMITTKPADSTESSTYVAAGGGIGAASKATEDLVALLVQLKNNGATTIVYNGTPYSWNTSLTDAGGGHITSKWADSSNNTLVSAIVTSLQGQITSAPNNAITKVSATMSVNGAEIVVAIDYVKGTPS